MHSFTDQVVAAADSSEETVKRRVCTPGLRRGGVIFSAYLLICSVFR